MNQKILSWFIQREPRERRVLIVGAIFLTIITIYFGIYEPFIKARTQLENIVTAQQETLQWMENARAEIQQLQAQTTHSPRRTDQLSLLRLIDQSLRQNPLSKVDKRIEPKGDDSVNLYFEQINFTALMRWLGQLHNKHHIRINTISLEKLSTPDTVKVRMTLHRVP